MSQLLCREIVGRRVRLLRTFESMGRKWRKGRVMMADGTHHGSFSLRTLRLKNLGHGCVAWVGAMRVPRSYFEILS